MKRDPSHGTKYVLFSILLVALVLRVAAAQSPNLAHPDEIFQTLEPAHRLAFGYGVVTWEWREGIRSWVFPAFLAAIMRATAWMGAGSSGYLLGVTLVLSLISLTAVGFAFAWARRAGGMPAAIIAAGACATWYQLVDFGGRALTEVFAAHLLLPGLYLGVYGEKIPERRRMLLAGLFCGLAFSLRIQLAPAIAFALVWFCGAEWRKRAAPLAVGFLLPIAIFGMVDLFTWSSPFQSFVGYFWVNAIEGRSKMFGTAPWYWYCSYLLDAMGPMLFLAVVGCLRSPFLGWMALIILTSHSAFSHKEPRFLYPLMPLIVTLAALGIAEILRSFTLRNRPMFPAWATILIGLLVCCLTSFLLAPRFPWWEKNAGGVVAFDRLSRNSGLCGAGLYDVAWFSSGGYAQLHRNVPIVVVPGASELAARSAAFNALIAPVGTSGLPADFRRIECAGGICLYQRPGVCEAPSSGDEIDAFLRRTGN